MFHKVYLRRISGLIISALRQVNILFPLAAVLGKMKGINGIWRSFLISEMINSSICDYLSKNR